ncbi:MAG: STAS domain-containing protein, partial [Anaerolineae bacterium]
MLKESLVLEDSVAKLRSALDACDHACHTRVVLDLVKTPLLNSLALDALLDAQDRMLHLGGWLKVTNITPTNLEILGVTGLVDYVKVLDRQEQNSSTEQQLQSPPKKGMKFGQILIDRGLISKEKVDEALRLQDKLGKSMG